MMARMSIARRLGVAAVLGALTLTGCTSEDSAPGSGASTPAGNGATEQPPEQTGDGTLRVGSLYSGPDSVVGLRRAQRAGIALAVSEINAAGGVLGEDVTIPEETRNRTDASAEAADQVEQGADVVVGALVSKDTRVVSDAVADAGAVLVSATSAGAGLPTGGRLVRTAPSEILLATVLADRLARDGRDDVGLLVRNDSYGNSLLREVRRLLRQQEIPVVVTAKYSPKAAVPEGAIAAIDEADLDAVVVIGYGEARRLVPALNEAGTGPVDEMATYLLDGNTTDYGEGARAAVEAGQFTGAIGLRPGAQPPEDWTDRLRDVSPGISDLGYAAEAYDAVVVSALAATLAESDAGSVLAEELVGVTRQGVACSTFAECRDLVLDGQDIDYDGVSGPLELSDDGSPTSATIGVYEYDAANRPVPVSYVGGRI